MGNFKKHIHPLLRRGKKSEAKDDENFAILNALDNVLNETEKDTIKSKIQSSLETATGEFLDSWGDWFGIYRKTGETDEHYRAHIIRHTLLKRGTVQSIIDAIKWFLDDNDANIEVYEPWKNIFYTNSSHLNGTDHLMGYYYRFAILDISLDRPFPPEIATIVQAFKPAGVLFYLGYDSGNDLASELIKSPYDGMTISTRQEIDRLTGYGLDIKGDLKASDVRGEVVTDNIFYTNKSHLNGTDVLAGAFEHGRNHLHLYGITEKHKGLVFSNSDTLATIKARLNELYDASYVAISRYDGLKDRRMVDDNYVYLVLNIKEYLSLKFNNIYTKVIGSNPTVVNKEGYSDFMKDPTLSFVINSLTNPNNPTKLRVRMLDFSKGSWQVITTKNLTQVDVVANVGLGSLVDYISNEGLVAIEFTTDNDVNVPVDIDYIGLTFKQHTTNGFDISESYMVDNKLEKEVPKYTAWSWSSDGSDRFTKVYPNDNLYTKGADIKVSGAVLNSITDTGFNFTGGNTGTGSLKLPLNAKKGDTVTVSFYVKGSQNVAVSFSLGITGSTTTKVSTNVTNTYGGRTVRTYKLLQDESFLEFTSIQWAYFFISDFKIELGDINTPYTPNPKDDLLGSYPKYVGYATKDSNNYTDYLWRPYLYKAWSWSSDGEDRFTKIYPSENLLLGTQHFSGDWENKGTWIEDTLYKGVRIYKKTTAWGGLDKPHKVKKGEVYTFSAYIKASSDADIRFYNGIDSDYNIGKCADFIRYQKTLTILEDGYIYCRFENANSTGTIYVGGYKLEKGSVATPYVPSPQDDSINATPQYIGIATELGYKADDYTWSKLEQ